MSITWITHKTFGAFILMDGVVIILKRWHMVMNNIIHNAFEAYYKVHTYILVVSFLRSLA